MVFLVASRHFLFSAHQVSLARCSFDVNTQCPLFQSWFEEEEHRFVQELEVKLDNLDARDMRQLNEVYAEVKRVNSKQLFCKTLL